MPQYENRTIEQSIQVPYTFPVLFTRDIFDVDNPALAEICSRHSAARVRKALVVIDVGVAEAFPELQAAIVAWFDHHPDILTLTRTPMMVTGGEAVKNDPAIVDAIQTEIDAGGIDRHSFVIAIGGGALLDMVGF